MERGPAIVNSLLVMKQARFGFLRKVPSNPAAVGLKALHESKKEAIVSIRDVLKV